MKTTRLLVVSLTAGALTLVSCTPTQQKYGLGGAAAGAAVAAITGGDSTDVARTAALAGAAGTGYAIYKERQGNTAPQPAQTPAATAQHPTGFPSGTPDVVISPHKPYNKINVKGLNPGQLVTDPTTDKIFVVPNQ